MKKLLLPKVLFVGPPRTGTTWIWEYLRARGDIVLPEGVKETWFFSSMFHKGVDWYASHFKHREDCFAVIEVDPTLFSHPEAPRRVHKVLGSDVMIVVTVRDPVERSWSHYLHARRYGWTKKPLEQAIEEIPDIIEASRYSKHISHWVSAFGEEQVAILSYEILRLDPLKFVKQICLAMEIPYASVPEALLRRKVNKSRDVRFPMVMQVMNKILRQIRSLRLYPIMEFAKRVGIQKLLYTPLNVDNLSNSEEKKMLFDILEEEYRFLSSLNELRNTT